MAGAISGKRYWERIVLVPGNHEVSRPTGTGRGDYLLQFRQFVEGLSGQGWPVSSPYSSAGSGACILAKVSKEGIPFALHAFPELQIEVLTLVSCFYSQGLDAKVLSLIEEYEHLKTQLVSGISPASDARSSIEKYFRQRIYLDIGFFSPDYVSAVPFELSNASSNSSHIDSILRIAVAHHPATKYFEMDEITESAHGRQLLDGLSKLGFTEYLHGHIHCAPEPSKQGVREIASGTLGGSPLESRHGFNMILWDQMGKPIVERYELRENRFRKVSVT